MTKELIYETDTDSDTEIRLVVAKTEDVEGIGWEFGVSRCKPLYLSIYLYEMESLCCTLENNTALQINCNSKK